jgi:hypothetical protein
MTGLTPGGATLLALTVTWAFAIAWLIYWRDWSRGWRRLGSLSVLATTLISIVGGFAAASLTYLLLVTVRWLVS